MENTKLYSITVTLLSGEKKLYGGIKGYELTNGHLILTGENHGVIIAAGQWVEFWSEPMQSQGEQVQAVSV